VAAALRHYGVFRDAVVREVAEAHDRFGDELVFQLEAPTVLVGLWSVPDAVRPAVARVLARQVAGVLTRLPADAKVVLHLCYGDLAHISLVRPTSLKPAVLFLNSLAPLLRRGRPAVHIPAAFGDQPPPTDDRFYEPLTRLDAEYPLYAGVVDHRDPDVSRTALSLFEAASGRPAEAVSTACGLGREPLAMATRAVAVCRTLTAATTHR
jgi:methionine synthase II (cobalamin-independent)